MILENWNLKHEQRGKVAKPSTPIYGTIKDAMIARVGTLDYAELDNLVIEGVNCRELSPKDCEFIELFPKVELFAFNDNCLVSLRVMPSIPTLQRIELCYNKIQTGLEAFQKYPLLHMIKLRGNRINSFEEIAKLGKCRMLTDLDLSANPCQKLKDYRAVVFNLCEPLETLDDLSKEQVEDRTDGESQEFNPNETDDLNFDKEHRGYQQDKWLDDVTSSSDASKKSSGAASSSSGVSSRESFTQTTSERVSSV